LDQGTRSKGDTDGWSWRHEGAIFELPEVADVGVGSRTRELRFAATA